MTAPVILIEAKPVRVADGTSEIVRLAGGGALVPYTYGGFNDWRSGVVGLPTLIASLDYTGGDFPVGSVPAAAEIEWAPAKLADLAAMAAYMWFDADITVRIGDEGAALPGIVISGQVLDAVAGRDGKLRISLADPASKLKKPLLTSRFAGTGGLEGPAEWEGLIKRRVWGRVWNVRGEPIDKANNIYCYADPTQPLQAINAVRDKGADAAALITLPWQGTASATFSALQAAAAPAGGGVRCPSIACVKWWTQPAGDLCADIKGEIGGGYVETTASIAQRLVEVIAGPAFAANTVAAANAVRPAAVGWVADSDTTTCASMLDELLGNSSLMWLLDANQQLVIRAWNWGVSVTTATSHAVARQKVLRPVAKRKLGYQRNELKMARGDIAAIVLAKDVAGLEKLAFGQNAVVNSDFTRSTYGFSFLGIGNHPADGNTSITLTDSGINLNSSYSGIRNVAWAHLNTSGGNWNAGPNAYVDAFATRGIWLGGNMADLRAFGLPVKQGDTIFARSLLAQHRCAAEMYALIFDSVGTLVEAPSWYGARENGAQNGNPANFNLVGGVYTSFHPDAALMQLMWRMQGDGRSDAYMFMTEPAMGVLPAGQTVVPPYNTGRVDPLGDQTATAQVVTSISPTNRSIAADYTGAITGSLGDVVWIPVVTQGGVSKRIDNLTSYGLSNGSGGTFVVDNTSGSGTKGYVWLTSMSALSASAMLTITYNGLQVGQIQIQIDKILSAAPTGGGTPTKTVTWTTGDFVGINTTSFVQVVAAVKTVALSSGESLYGSAALDYYVSGGALDSRTMSFKWQYSGAGANSWTDFGAAITGSTAVSRYNGTPPDYEGQIPPVPGSVSVVQTRSGLGAGNYDVRLVATCSATGRVCTPQGSASVQAKV